MLCYNFNEVVEYRTDYNELIFKAIYSLKDLYFTEYTLSSMPLFFYHWDEEDFYIVSLSSFSLKFLENSNEYNIEEYKNDWKNNKVIDVVKKNKKIRFETNSTVYNFKSSGKLNKKTIKKFDAYLNHELSKRMRISSDDPKKLYDSLLFIKW